VLHGRLALFVKRQTFATKYEGADSPPPVRNFAPVENTTDRSPSGIAGGWRHQCLRNRGTIPVSTSATPQKKLDEFQGQRGYETNYD
jgi:hypothetical protein